MQDEEREPRSFPTSLFFCKGVVRVHPWDVQSLVGDAQDCGFVDSRLEKEAKLLPTQSLGFSTSMFDVDFAEGKYSKDF